MTLPARDTPLTVACKGFCMGAADVVPGVSGGTMALILGIYLRLLNAIKSVDVALLRHLGNREWRVAALHVDIVFLVPLGLGIVGAVAFFTRIVPLPELVVEQPVRVYGLFFGLVAGSTVMLAVRTGIGTPRDWFSLAAGCAIGLLVVTAVPASTPEATWFIFLSGMIAICAMVLPGISGSFILLLLGKYSYVLGAIGQLDFSIIIPFAAGAALGLALFTRVLGWLLERYYQSAMMLIIGFLVASLWVLWPFQQRSYAQFGGKEKLIGSQPVWPDGTELLLNGALFVVIGLAIVGVIEIASRRRARVS
ncbi:MAG: DUF368 domain-containing protein [Gammaproteobacteria bacterium]|nr:DUF368 domain-containing protein [Gammaproteobacteria bacterium]